MTISDTFRSWCHAVVMMAFAIQFVVSCKPEGSHDPGSSPGIQKGESKRTIEPVSTINSPELRRLIETVDRDEREKLVVQLGEKKVVEAVPYLVAKITAVKGSQAYNAMDWDRAFPCSFALIQIGDVGVPQIQNQVTKAESNLDQLMLLHTLVQIKGAQFTSDWLGTLQPGKQTNIPEDRLHELKNWVQSQVK